MAHHDIPIHHLLIQIVDGPLYVSQRGANPKLESVWKLGNVHVVDAIHSFSLDGNGTVKFKDGTKLSNVDKVIFATGYRLSYPFIPPNPVAKTNRLTGFYQHVFNIGDPTLTVIGQSNFTIDLGAARMGKEEIKYKGPSAVFHEIAPDFKEYCEWLRIFAGPPGKGTRAYELPPFEDTWSNLGLAILGLRVDYAERLARGEKEDAGHVEAKL